MQLEDLQLFGGAPAAMEEGRRKLDAARERRARVEENLRRVDTTPSGNVRAVQASRWEPLPLHAWTFEKPKGTTTEHDDAQDDVQDGAAPEQEAPQARPAVPLERTIADHLRAYGWVSGKRLRRWTRAARDDVRLLRLCAALQTTFGKEKYAAKIRERIRLLDPDSTERPPIQREPLMSFRAQGGELADVRDGLTSSQRAVLVALWSLGAWPEQADVPISTLVERSNLDEGTVQRALQQLGALSTSSPLVDGAIDPSTARYACAKLTALGEHAFWPLRRGAALEEPVLRGNVPCLLLLGSWGMARSHGLPHNLRELVHAGLVGSAALPPTIAGPDLPTGGVCMPTRSLYQEGRGEVTIWPTYAWEQDSVGMRVRVVFSGFPFPVSVERARARVEELQTRGDLEGVCGIDVLSDGRLCVEVEHIVFAHDVTLRLGLALRSTFELSLEALVDGQPETLHFGEFVSRWIERITSVFLERQRGDVRRVAERAHLLEGFLVAQHFAPVVTAMLRAADGSDEPALAEWALERLWSAEPASHPVFARVPRIDPADARAFVSRLAGRLAEATAERPWRLTHSWEHGFSAAQARAVKSARRWLGRSSTFEELVQLARDVNRTFVELDSQIDALVAAHLDHLGRTFGAARCTSTQMIRFF